MPTPTISIVIPVFNEELTLPILFSRLIPVMDKYGKPYEVIFVNDGSKDNSQKVLAELFTKRPDVIRAVQFMRNYGQHPAIMAGFERMRGEVAVTLDCDLQNPPEDIPKILDLIEQGHDVVGGYRGDRQDLAWRKFVSKISNIVRARITNINMRDHGCMLRAYRRHIVDQIVEAGDATPFVTALSQSLAANPAEIEVGHEERAAGVSNYNLYKLIRYNFDLMTGFSLVPLQMFTITGMILSVLSFLLVIYMGLRRLFIGPEAQGVFTLFAILFLLVSVAITGLGIVGEYVGRIYMEVRKRPKYTIKEVLETK
ncbi:MAG: glycosyltransferase [Pseudomonadota bacterium]|nr:glycosyltransferase [Pseudomonadota bacterium]MDE3037334.1 glycosyltransferase [Pseudomonadota bacterium]